MSAGTCIGCGRLLGPEPACRSCGRPVARPAPPHSPPFRPPAGSAPQGLHYAPWWQRLTAFLIDFGAVVTAASSLTLPIAALTGSIDDLVSDDPDQRALIIFTIALVGLALAGWCTYQIIMIGRFEQTLGKRALGLVVRSEDGSRCGYGRAANRELVGRLLIEFLPSVTLLLPVLSYLHASWHERRQTWHDQIAETIVVVDAPRPR